MSAVTHQTVSGDENGMRLDRWFRARYPELTHGRLQKMLRTGQVRVDGARAKASARLESGQDVRVPPLPVPVGRKSAKKPQLSAADREFVKSLVLYRDDGLIVINKPAGLAAQGGSRTGRHLDGMLDGLTFKAPERPRLVHRLDRDTSGAMALARNRLTANALATAFRARRVTKVYWALVSGVPDIAAGTVDLALIKAGRAGDQRMRVAEAGSPGAQRARTHYEVVDRAGRAVSWLRLEPETGRTHQLRVHLEAIGHPILGDTKYRGSEESPAMDIAPRLHLHACRLQLPDDVSNGLEIEAPLPDDLLGSWRYFGFDPSFDV